jgi:hypothetical protein
MEKIIEINRRSVFTLEEAQELLPIVFRITKSYSQKVESLIAKLEGLTASNEGMATATEAQVNSLIQEWQSKVQKLGALPKGLWIADFDAGDGYFCWKYPERGIEFWHRYSDGYSKRVRVSAMAERTPFAAAEVAAAASAQASAHSAASVATGAYHGDGGLADATFVHHAPSLQTPFGLPQAEFTE